MSQPMSSTFHLGMNIKGRFDIVVHNREKDGQHSFQRKGSGTKQLSSLSGSIMNTTFFSYRFPRIPTSCEESPIKPRRVVGRQIRCDDQEFG
jgi:hypothetical protein